MKRAWLLLLVVLLIPLLPWLIVGAPLEQWIEGSFKSLSANPQQRWLAGGLGLIALAGDSFLPVPSTIVMSGLGWAFGVAVGGTLASIGLFCSGLIAYGLCRRFGAGLAQRLVGEKGLSRVRASMDRIGPLTIAVTRSVPLIQEASACLAGLSQMKFRNFCGALAVGCVATGFAYATIGATAVANERVAIVLSLLVPAISWPVIFFTLRLRAARDSASNANKE